MKKLIVKVIALAVAIISVFSFVGCTTAEVTRISQREFSEVYLKSMQNVSSAFEKNEADDYVSFTKPLTFSYEKKTEDDMYGFVEYRKTSDGEIINEKLLTDKTTNKYTISIFLKQIDGAMFVNIVTVSEVVELSQDFNDDMTIFYQENKSVVETEWNFGKNSNGYYVSKTEKGQEIIDSVEVEEAYYEKKGVFYTDHENVFSSRVTDILDLVIYKVIPYMMSEEAYLSDYKKNGNKYVCEKLAENMDFDYANSEYLKMQVDGSENFSYTRNSTNKTEYYTYNNSEKTSAKAGANVKKIEAFEGFEAVTNFDYSDILLF